MDNRRKTRRIRIGIVPVGGGAPVSVQSMTNTDTRDVRATVAQIRSLAREGCEIARVAVPDAESGGRARRKIRAEAGSPAPVSPTSTSTTGWRSPAPTRGRMACGSTRATSAGRRTRSRSCGRRGRTGSRCGSASTRGLSRKTFSRRYGGPTPKALVASAARYLKICEKARFTALKFSLKASDVVTTIEAYRLFSRRYDFPLHIGVTEAGTIFSGTIKSSVGIGVLLAEGIGDTLRVSLTGASRGRGPRRLADPEKPRAEASGAGVHLVPHLRPGVDRYCRDRDRGGAAPVAPAGPPEGRRDGVRRERTPARRARRTSGWRGERAKGSSS